MLLVRLRRKVVLLLGSEGPRAGLGGGEREVREPAAMEEHDDGRELDVDVAEAVGDPLCWSVFWEAATDDPDPNRGGDG